MSFLRDLLLEPAPRGPEPGFRPGAPGLADPRFEPPDAAANTAGASRAQAAAAAPATAPEVAVLAPAGRVATLGAATALLLARRQRAAAVLVAVWAPGHASAASGSAPAVPAARRLAAVLAGRGLEAGAAGRMATLVLPDDPVQATAAAARAVAASPGSPVVLALGARAGAFDALLSAQDRVLVVPPPNADRAMTELALAGLSDVAPDVRVCAADATPAARALVATGLAVPAALRRALRPALEGLGP